MEYTVSREAVDRASSPGFIDELGPYTGKFTQAYQVLSRQGTVGIAFDFESTAGLRARWTLWTHKADGTAIFGEGHVSSILACMKLRSIKGTSGIAKVYDFEAGAVIEQDTEVYPDLINRPIGVFLQTEEYERSDGEIGVRMVPAGFFQAETRLVAKEIMERITTPAQFDRTVERLRHRPLRQGGAGRAASPAGASARASTSSTRTLEDMDDDIPF